MPAEILPIDDTADDSAEQVVADGSSVIFGIKVAGTEIPDGVAIEILIKDDGVGLWPVAVLDNVTPQWRLQGPATYVHRRREGAACGSYSG